MTQPHYRVLCAERDGVPVPASAAELVALALEAHGPVLCHREDVPALSGALLLHPVSALAKGRGGPQPGYLWVAVA